MKIYKREEFLKLPAGTLYAKGKPFCFEDLCLKGDTWTNDFLCRSLVWIEPKSQDEMPSDLSEMLELGISRPLEQGYGRDGCFDDEEIFLVYEKEDLNELLQIINEALIKTVD